jgi:cysteinyl-tRNA synthetase
LSVLLGFGVTIKMSLIQDITKLEKDIAQMKVKITRQQMIYYTIIDGLVLLSQKHRVSKNYTVSDELRNLLTSVGVKIKQGTDGYKYEEIPKSLMGMTVNDQWYFDDSE